MTPTLTVGELITVVIRGARVARKDSTDCLWLDLGAKLFDGHKPEPVFIANGLPGQTATVTVERVAPAEWPPQVGDIWADCDETEWCAITNPSTGCVELQSTVGARGWQRSPDKIAQAIGPMTLLRRRDWTPPPAAARDQAGTVPVDERAALIAGLRELADLLESRPNLDFWPRVVGWFPGQSEQDAAFQIQAWAQALGASIEHRPHDHTIQHVVHAQLAGLHVEPVWIEKLPELPAGQDLVQASSPDSADDPTGRTS